MPKIFQVLKTKMVGHTVKSFAMRVNYMPKDLQNMNFTFFQCVMVSFKRQDFLLCFRIHRLNAYFDF